MVTRILDRLLYALGWAEFSPEWWTDRERRDAVDEFHGPAIRKPYDQFERGAKVEPFPDRRAR